MSDAKCKKCRRQGIKLFLRGERCYSQKCAMVKRPVPPGPKGKRRKGSISEYGKELKEKQKLKLWYGLREKQFKRYAKEILQKARRSQKQDSQDAAQLFVGRLESRLDNVVFRIGLVSSRSSARQLVNHGYFLVNNRPNDIPSTELSKGDEVKIKPTKLKKKVFQNLDQNMKKQRLPDWLQFNSQTGIAKLVGEPAVSAEELPAEISSIFEFYSR